MPRCAVALLGALAATFVVGHPVVAQESSSAVVAVPPVSFNADVAPLLATRCSGCHHPGGPAPFSVLDYAQVAPRAKAIVKAIETRVMPPWKPEPGYGGPFVGEKRVSDRELALIRRWADAGAPLGEEVVPAVSHDAHDHGLGNWQLGTPDLVVSSAEAFELPAGGTDRFRNFAIKLPLTASRYVKGIEFQPDNHVVTHHANVRIDTTSASLHLDELDPAPGFQGEGAPTAAFPEGYFLGWTPGQLAPLLPPGLAWRVPVNSSLVVELHLVPSAQVEQVGFRVGFYFSDTPPARTPVMVRLGRQDIDIAPGQSRYVIRDEYKLPADVEVQSVQPHAHNLATDVRGYATLPDGTRQWLIYIKDWDFHNQDVYRFETPVRLPRGATLHMEYSYDNSPGNQVTPGATPRRVRWGQYTSDEMGDLWVQLLPVESRDYTGLVQSARDKEIADNIVGFRTLLDRSPENGLIRANLAEALIRLGRKQEALRYFREHVRLEPNSATAHYNLGTGLSTAGEWDEAIREFERALALDPKHVSAHSGIGNVLLYQGNPEAALGAFRRALEIDPRFATGYNNIGVALQRLGRESEALVAYLQAADFAPDDADARFNAGRLFESHRRYDVAERLYREAMELVPDDSAATLRLAWVLATSPGLSAAQRGEALTLVQAVPPQRRTDADTLDILAAAKAATGDFKGAMETMDAALDLLIADQNERRRDIEERRGLYRRGVPYVAPAP